MSRHRRGEGSVYKAGSDNWVIQYYVNGRRKMESSRTTDKQQAEKLLRKRVYEASQGLLPDPSALRKLTVVDLYECLERDYRINRRKSLDDLEARWRLHVKPFFGHMRPANVSTDMVDRYTDKRQEEGAENATINRELALLKRAFSLGMESTPPKVERIPHFRMLKENNVRQGFLDSGQYDRLADECAKFGLWMRTAFELGYTYGWRHSEVLGLEVGQVSLPDDCIHLNPGETKNDEGREAPLTPILRQLLALCIQGKRPDERVLTRDDGKPVLDFRGAWESATEKAGKPGLLFHDLRRTAVRNMVRAGIPEKIAMLISGHKTRSVFERYNIISTADIRDAGAKLSFRTASVEPELPENGADFKSNGVKPN